jgi:tRNA (mo5U34)-methyltransferase
MKNPRSMEIGELAAAAGEFRSKLDRLKKSHAASVAWYPYDSFSVFPVLKRLLRDDRRKLLSLADTASLLDVGCGDGALSFFFESCGCRVVAVDNAGPNFNGTRGFQTLAAALSSSVELLDRDVDIGLDLRGRTFGLALCLGILYHVKNPWLLLETLARHSRYCLLSTRVAQVTVNGTGIEREPVAYLLDPAEANADASNYWIFSEAGLRRILERTGWDVCDFVTTGFDRGSNPAAGDRDQRAFCLLSSKLPDPWLGCDLEGGWHGLEGGSWRWTERVFSVRLAAASARGGKLRFRFTLPAAVLRETGPLRLRAEAGGAPLSSCEYGSEGEHTYEQAVPDVAVRDGVLPVRFELDKAMRPGGSDVRELGVQVIFWSVESKTPAALRPIAFEVGP